MTRTKKAGSLRSIQQIMLEAVRRPLAADESMQKKWSDGSSTAAIVEQIIKPNDRLTSFDRLQIYNQQYWWRLLGAFAEDFRGVRAVIGDKKFDHLAIAYLESCPSTSWTLRDLGGKLPGFLKTNTKLTAPHSALAYDMARVEWARVVAFDGAEHKPVNPQKLAQSDPTKLQLKIQPYVSLLKLDHPIDTAIRRLKHRSGGSVASNAVSSEATTKTPRIRVTRSRTPVYLAAHRLDYSVYYKRLEPWQFTLLNALNDGVPLAAACEAAFVKIKQRPEKSAALIQEAFATWTGFGWFW